MNALALGADEGRDEHRYASGSCKQADPEISEWGNPLPVMRQYPFFEFIGNGRQTRGTETSQYPEEEKETSIPQVAASETGRAQTERLAFRGCRTLKVE